MRAFWMSLAVLVLVLGCVQSAPTLPVEKPQSQPAPAPVPGVPPAQPSVASPAETAPQEDQSMNPALTVEKGDRVQVLYKGTFDDGKEFDSSVRSGNRPLEFIAGAGQVISGFDKAVMGMHPGEEKNIHLAAEEAYGLPKPELIKEFSLADLKKQGIEPKVGDTLPAQGPYGAMLGVVVDVTSTTAKVDFNSEMAGKALNFWIQVKSVKKPEKPAAAASGASG